VAGFDASQALAREAALDYVVPSGRYWQERDRFDAKALAEVDQLWSKAVRDAMGQGD